MTIINQTVFMPEVPLEVLHQLLPLAGLTVAVALNIVSIGFCYVPDIT
jgi:hypothetical protein